MHGGVMAAGFAVAFAPFETARAATGDHTEVATLPTRSAITVAATPLVSFAEFDRDESWRAFLGPEVGARVRLSSRWALSPFVRFAWEVPSRSTSGSVTPGCIGPGSCEGWSTHTTFSSQIGTLGLALNLHPFDNGFWVAPSAASLMLRDTTEHTESRAYEVSFESWYHWGVEFGAAVGFELHRGNSFAYSFSTRVAEAWFPTDRPVPPNLTASSGPLVALSFGGWFALE